MLSTVTTMLRVWICLHSYFTREFCLKVFSNADPFLLLYKGGLPMKKKIILPKEKNTLVVEIVSKAKRDGLLAKKALALAIDFSVYLVGS